MVPNPRYLSAAGTADSTLDGNFLHMAGIGEKHTAPESGSLRVVPAVLAVAGLRDGYRCDEPSRRLRFR